MKPLRRRLKSYVAALRLSGAQLILFVEGRDNDPLFYGLIGRQLGSDLNLLVEVRLSSELPGNAPPGKGGNGGQLTLKLASGAWSRYEAKHAAKWKSKKLLTFCIDKDVEDLIGVEQYHPGLIRTPLHSVENHIVASVNIQQAVERAISTLPGELNGTLLAQIGWSAETALLWLDWVTFCVAALRLSATGISNFSSVSLFNVPSDAPTDTVKLTLHKARLQKVSGMSGSDFENYWLTVREFLRELVLLGQHDRMFKGKWYIDVLFAQLESSGYGTEVRSIGKSGLNSAFRAAYSVRDEDYKYYRDEIQSLMATQRP